MAGNHKLPELPYAYDALEPYIDEQTMRLHHDKHHLGYVNGLNAAENALAEARKSGDFSQIQHLERLSAFHGSGHFNHVMFWNNMCPADQYTDPTGDLLKQIEKDFGSFDGFKAQFAAAAKAVEASGWAFLCWQPAGNQLVTLAAENHHKQTQFTAIPILALDVWEHAYYLKYQNNRGGYVDNFFKIINWKDVAQNFESALKYKFPVK